MLKEFSELWYKSKSKIKERLENYNFDERIYIGYDTLLKIILEEFNNQIIIEECSGPTTYFEDFNLNIKKIDYGDYQGTLIFTFSRDIYQPEAYETFYTFVNYGSCSCCDALLHIISYYADEDKNLQKQGVNDLLTLCLHLVEHINCFDITHYYYDGDNSNNSNNSNNDDDFDY